jgi:formylmethanofuran dehydrogenase subunit E
MENLKEYYDVALAFHGHKCPAMPMGLRAGLAAMKALGVERAKDKELVVESETGEGHAAGCFLDGLMVATGATYGKGNIKKLSYNKLAFTLIDKKTSRAVRVSLKPQFVENAMKSPFVQKRKGGVLPQDVSPEITDPQVQRVLSLPESDFLDVSEVSHRELENSATTFDVKRCSRCGDATFVTALKDMADGRTLCIPCIEGERKA